MRVPSANLSWTEVVGKVASTTRPDDGDGAVFKAVAVKVGSEAAEAGESLPPKVLPTPWNADRRFGGSYMKQWSSVV